MVKQISTRILEAAQFSGANASWFYKMADEMANATLSKEDLAKYNRLNRRMKYYGRQ